MTLNNRTKRTFAAAVLIAAGLPIPVTAEQQKTQCAALYRAASGREVDASFSASQYSEDHVGAVGISIFPGLDKADIDPHATGLKLVQLLNQQGIEAECFVNRSQIRRSTSISYKINGLAWREGSSELELAEAENAETIRSVTIEAKTIRKLLGVKQP